MSDELFDEDRSSRKFRLVTLDNLPLWLLVLASLALNGLVITQLIALRQSAHDAVVDAGAVLADLQTQSFNLAIEVDDTIVIDTEFPVQDTVVVPIQTEIPVSGAASVEPIPGLPLAVPFGANVPVDIVVDVPIDTTIAVFLPVEIDLEVPVEFAIADLPLSGTLDDAQASLDALAKDLEGPIAP